MTDFTAFSHPVLAVACPDCRKGAGVMCYRPSGHRASDFHRARKVEADRVFIAQHDEAASIERVPDGWLIEPFGLRDPAMEPAPKSASPPQLELEF